MTLSRSDMFLALGVIQPDPPTTHVAAVTQGIYDAEAQLAWERVDDSAPHGAVWHTSFHASTFPGPDDGCARRLIYSLANIPEDKPSPGWLIALSDAGKDIEDRIVSRWSRAGILLTAPPDAEYQTNFQDPDSWLTCSLDAALDLRPKWPYVHPVDTKGKDHAVVEAMQRGERGPDAGHVKQVMVQTHFCRLNHEKMGWDKLGLLPAIGGSILYVSRARPLTMHEHFVEYDEELMAEGFAVLDAARQGFEASTLPERPKSWRWTEEPCKWCHVKRDCKADIKADIADVAQSNAVARAVRQNPSYDFATVREAVLSRWRNARKEISA